MTLTIDGTEVSDITIDGTQVQEVTIDGSVVYTADIAGINNYLEDDFGDNALSGRTNADSGAFHYQEVPNQPGDTLVGRYRPEWTAENGSPGADNGSLALPAGDTTMQMVSLASTFVTGEWVFDQWFSTSPSTNATAWTLFSQSKTISRNRLIPGYFIALLNGSDFNFYKEDSSNTTTKLIDASRSSGETTQATFRTTRDNNGNWEIFEDGTSNGTATDTTYTSGKWTAIGNNSDAESRADNLQVI